MNQEVRDTLQEIVDLSFEEKVKLGEDALSRFYSGLVRGGIPEKEVPDYIIAFTKLFVSADQNCDKAEYDFFRAVTGIELSVKEFYDLTNGGLDEEFISACLDIVRILNHEDRMAVVIYGAALLSCDDTINVMELKLFDKLIA